MIFYFTGTGNSWYAASKLLKEGEQLVSIAECMKESRLEFDLTGEETLGFVFPVYFYGLPSIVAEFVKRLKVENVPSYVYSVITCGGSIGNSGGMLAKLLRKKNMNLSSVYSLKMPDNYIMMYQPPKDSEVEAILAKADETLKQYRKLISLRETTRISGGVSAKVMSSVLYPMYVKGRKTAPFYTDERCVGCGVCAGRCPVGAIQMVEGKPTWVREKCVMCMACCRCNAIQYDKKILKRRRYVNPEYKKVTSCH